MNNDNKLFNIEIFDKILSIIFIGILFIGLIFIMISIYSILNKATYPMQSIRCLVKADEITYIEKDCIVLGKLK